tara:strand:+ start:16270 stop:17586 length:1317 start_codon:yes stop_codon:yes gene_type:complete
MLKLKSNTFRIRHNEELKRFITDNSNVLNIYSNNSDLSINNSGIENFIIKINSDASDNIDQLNNNFYSLIIITDIFELTDDVYRLLNRLKQKLTKDGKVIITSINPKWNLLLLIFEFLKLKNKTVPRSYIHSKKASNIAEGVGLELINSFSRQVFPFELFGLGNLINKFLEIICFKFNFGINTYFIFKAKNADYKMLSKSIIIPAKNEEKNLDPLLSRIPNFESEYEIIIICAESEDNTVNKAYEIQNRLSELDIKVMIQESKGKGGAVFEALKITNGELIAILDSDISVDPETLRDFFEILEYGNGDFVNGTRFIYKKQYGAMRNLNSLGNIFFQAIISLVINSKLSDSLCGTKVFKKSQIKKILEWQNLLKIKDPFGDFDFIFSAAFSGNKIVEYPIHYRARVYGSTQISRFKDGFRLLFYFINSFIVFNSSKNIK